MIHSKEDMKKWKNEEIRYFQNYMNNFDKDSREYKDLKKRIEILAETEI
ncbi:MAG: hypothetical protein JW982_02050 [Spirochaetes bacterium]|nr:hypothetical protein [Spirochaetota bacterium]